MPRRCSVFGCRSNYDSELEQTTTFSLPTDENLRKLWLRSIPTDLSHLKHPVICVKHFEEACVIRVDRVMDKGVMKVFPRTIPKLTENAVPTIFPNTYSYCRKSAPKTHFEDSQFEQNRADGWKRLKLTAVPTIFNVSDPPRPKRIRRASSVCKQSRNERLQMLEAVECKVEIREDDSGSGVVFAPQMFECKDQPPAVCTGPDAVPRPQMIECKDQPSAVCTGPDAVPRPQMLDAIEVKMEPPEENSDVDVVDDSQMFEAVELKMEPPEDTTTSDTACESQVFEFVAVKTEPCKGIPLGTEVDALELQAPAPTDKGAKSRKTADSAAVRRSPATRGQKLKPTIPRQARKAILNVAECCEEEKKTRRLMFPLSEPLKRAAEYVGRSVEDVAELRLGGSAPAKRRKMDGEKTDVENRVIRETIEEFYTVRKSLPTLGKLAAALREKTGCEWQSAPALRRTLKALGFVWRRVGDAGGRTFLLERFGQVRRRARFIVAMKYAREVGRKIFYVDESWIDTRLDCGKCHGDGRATANSDTCLVVWNVGSRNGFVGAATHTFRNVSSKKWTTAADFEEWFETVVLPNLPPASVVVMDDAAHHCRQADPAPSAYDPKAHMVAWLRQRGVECDDSLRKYVLWELVRASGGSRKDYVVDQMASVRGHSVLRLPPNARDLSAGDLAWAQVAEYVRGRATPRLSFGDLQKVVNTAIGSVTAADWEGYCERVRAVEEEYWRRDGVVEAAVDEVVRNPDSSDDSGDSVTEDSESESD